MILIAFGTRPEYIKLKPIIDEFEKENIPFQILFTGQHEMIKDQIMHSCSSFIHKNESPNRLNDIFINNLKHFEPQNIYKEKYDAVMVHGDTSSTASVALAAFHHQIPVIHIEAGMRTGNNQSPYPEETNRKIVSSVASYHFCPTAISQRNLLWEGIRNNTFVVGNTVIDGLEFVEPVYDNKILITMHRRENHWNLDKWFGEINRLAEIHDDLEFILPIHPNPNVQIHKHLLTNINTIEPVSRDELINIIKECLFIITDSGGIQEEAAFFRKKVIVCRENTERPEGLGVFAQLCGKPNQLEQLFVDFYFNPEIPKIFDCPYGDGQSAKKITKIIKEKLYA